MPTFQLTTTVTVEVTYEIEAASEKDARLLAEEECDGLTDYLNGTIGVETEGQSLDCYEMPDWHEATIEEI